MWDMTISQGERVLRTVPADTYAHRLMLARAHAGNLSIRAAAEKCGLNYANWSNWERGMRSRDLLEDVESISDGLGVDRDWLLFGGPLAEPEGRARRVTKRYSTGPQRPGGSSSLRRSGAARSKRIDRRMAA